MRVTIIGLDHELQTSAQRIFSADGLPAAEAGDKRKYRAILESAIKRPGTAVVAEEWCLPGETIARDLARTLGVRYECVDMGPDERRARGIPLDYAINPGVSAEDRDAWHRAREEFMVQGMLRAAEPGLSAVIVCGLDHVVGIARLLAKDGHAVEQLRLSQANGFDLRWLDSNLGSSQHAG
jgi:hypothetical protein